MQEEQGHWEGVSKRRKQVSINSLPARNKANRGFKVVECPAADFTSQVVTNTAALACLVDNDKSTCLADSIRDLPKG